MNGDNVPYSLDYRNCDKGIYRQQFSVIGEFAVNRVYS